MSEPMGDLDTRILEEFDTPENATECLIDACRKIQGIKTVDKERRCYALAITKLEEALMWMERARKP